MLALAAVKKTLPSVEPLEVRTLKNGFVCSFVSEFRYPVETLVELQAELLRLRRELSPIKVMSMVPKSAAGLLGDRGYARLAE